MTATTQTAGQAVQQQLADISSAIEWLQEQADAITSEIDPGTDHWSDVAKYAHVAEIAHKVLEVKHEV